MYVTAQATSRPRTILDDLIIVVPAPLHGPHVPRQALRSLGGSPLIAHAIRRSVAATGSSGRVVVVTDDEEVAMKAERDGCVVILDPAVASRPIFDPAIVHCAVSEVERRLGRSSAVVLVLNPASPLLRPSDLTSIVTELMIGDNDSLVASASTVSSGDSTPVICSRREAITDHAVIGRRVGSAAIPVERSLTISSLHDWWVCERLLNRKRIVIVVAGDKRIGMGHIYRTLLLAHEMHNHEIVFVCTRGSELAVAACQENRYETVHQGHENLEDTVLAHDPDLVINDFLDTTERYVAALKQRSARVINFEDVGPGAALADLVINEVYGETGSATNALAGPEVFCIRDEFLEAAARAPKPVVKEVLITFGGVDENNLTERVLRVVSAEAATRGIHLTVVTGSGYDHDKSLTALMSRCDPDRVTRANGTKRMSDYMARADIAFSSAGRTLFELAHMGVPAVVMACNTREESHPFASSHGGFIYLGRHDTVCDDALRTAFRELIDDVELRRGMRERLQQFDFSNGRQRVLTEISRVLGAAL